MRFVDPKPFSLLPVCELVSEHKPLGGLYSNTKSVVILIHNKRYFTKSIKKILSITYATNESLVKFNVRYLCVTLVSHFDF
jgi:hypothetical protein